MAIQLPTQKRKKQVDPHGVNIVLYGPNGLGKTTWANMCENTFIMATEPGHDAIEGYVEQIYSWDQFHDFCTLLKQGNHNYKRVCIDTGPGLYRICLDHYCKKSNVNHISLAEGGWGRGPDVANNAFLAHIQGLALLPYGLIFISHMVEKTIKTPTAAEYTRFLVDLPEREKAPIRSQVLGLFDCIFYMTLQRVDGPVDGEDETTEIRYRRVLKTEPSAYYEARDRYHYLPPTIILPEPPANGYDAYVRAFERGRNEKEGTGNVKGQATPAKNANASAATPPTYAPVEEGPEEGKKNATNATKTNTATTKGPVR